MLKKSIASFLLKSFTPQSFFSSRTPIANIPMLDTFISQNQSISQNPLNFSSKTSGTPSKSFYIETYGCQMNESDSEIVNSILISAGYLHTTTITSADIVLINTCAIREGAETRIWGRLNELRRLRTPNKQPLILGVLGCMAGRLKEKLLEKSNMVDFIAGPDAYRDLPHLLVALEASPKSVNVQLSIEETYADIRPIRFKPSSPQAYVSIMRGCNNMCSFCIVPFTRGRERSRDLPSILDEIKGLRDQGVKEITLLGQNVNSYHDNSDSSLQNPYENTPGFGETYKLRAGLGWRFESLLEKTADAFPEMRIRFTSPHPKNFPKSVLEIIKAKPNICKSLHLPAQSGNSSVLLRMRRNYTREAYMGLVETVRSMIPEISLSTDMIAGFCGETEEEFKDSLNLMESVKYDQAFLFAYSMREKTHAHRNYKDDVPEDVKLRRLKELIDVFQRNQEAMTKIEMGRLHLAMVEGASGMKYPGQLKGRSDTNKRVFIKQEAVHELNGELRKNQKEEEIKVGDYVLVLIEDLTKKSLFGKPLGKMKLKDFAELSQNKAFICKEKTQEILAKIGIENFKEKLESNLRNENFTGV